MMFFSWQNPGMDKEARRTPQGILPIRRTLKFKVSRNKAKLELIFRELNINTVAVLQEALMNLEGTHPPVRQLAHDDCGNDKLERQGCYTRSCQFRFGPHFGWAFN